VKTWTKDALRIVFAAMILSVAFLVAIAVSVGFHLRSSTIPGIVAVLILVGSIVCVERAFPSVYRRSRKQEPWWGNRGVLTLVTMIVVAMFSSWMSALWFGLLLICGSVGALILHFFASRGEPLEILGSAAKPSAQPINHRKNQPHRGGTT